MNSLMSLKNLLVDNAGQIFGFREVDRTEIEGRQAVRISTRVKTCDDCYADIYVFESGPNFELTDGHGTFWGLENVGCDEYLSDPRVIALVRSVKGVSLINDEISMEIPRSLDTEQLVQAFHDFYLALAYAGSAVMLKERR